MLHLPPVPLFSTKARQDVYEQPHSLNPDYSNQLRVPRLQSIISPLSQRLLLQLFTLQTSPLTSHPPNKSAGDNSVRRAGVRSWWGVCPEKWPQQSNRGQWEHRELWQQPTRQAALEALWFCIGHSKVWESRSQRGHCSQVSCSAHWVTRGVRLSPSGNAVKQLKDSAVLQWVGKSSFSCSGLPHTQHIQQPSASSVWTSCGVHKLTHLQAFTKLRPFQCQSCDAAALPFCLATLKSPFVGSQKGSNYRKSWPEFWAMQDSCGFKKGLSHDTTAISKEPWCDDSVSTQLLSKQVAEHQGCSSGWTARARIESRWIWICSLWSVHPSSRGDSGKGPNQLTQVHWNSIKGYHTLPGRKISHEKLWDQLLERHRDVRVVRTRDVVQLNGSQDTILHVEVLHVLCPLTALVLLRPGSCTDVAGHILLHQQRAITLCGCEGFKESKQTGNNVIHTSWGGTRAPSAFQCPQHDLDVLPGNGHAHTAAVCCRVLTGIENSFAKYTGTVLGRQDCGSALTCSAQAGNTGPCGLPHGQGVQPLQGKCGFYHD